MGTRPRWKPDRLGEKLRTIRSRLGLSQAQIAKLLELQIKNGGARVSEYENGVRELGLRLLLRYARVAGVSVDVLIDDALDLPETIKPKRNRKTAAICHTETFNTLGHS
jgi:transcriptional regulator with XRE-family HTH domain